MTRERSRAQPGTMRTAAPPAGGLDLRALEIFVAVSNARSMSRAAVLLGITQGAISQQIAKLEANLGLPLLAREGRELRLLPAGTNLLFHARRILEDVRACEQSMRRFTGYSYPDVLLGIINTMSKILTAPLIDGLDGIVENLHLQTSVNMRHQEEMAAGRIDILVSAQYFDPDTYEVYPITTEPMVLLTPRGWLAEGPVDLAALARGLPLAHFSAKRRIGQLTVDYLGARGVPVSRAMEFDQITTLMDLVGRRAGWAIATPYCLLEAEARLGAIDVRLLPAPTPRRTVSVITRRGRFGDLPALLARRCRHHLSETVLPRLAPLIPADCLPEIG
ncbi:LysR family transcriptional regulator [Segnochrobactraceae bacterium EtOH-i3]